MSGLSPHGVAVLLFTIAVFAAFIRDRLPIATVSLAILALLPTGFALFPLQVGAQQIDPLRFFAGFGHPALIAICALMVLGHGIVVTGALEPLARKLATWVVARPRTALLAVLAGAGAASGVVNDTPVVVLLIPLLLAAARRAKAPAAAMLLPMNYAVLMGGMATTIGTSTNLIVVAIAAELGVGPFSLFSFSPLVALAAIPGLAYLWLVAPKLLARVESPQEHLSDDAFDAELHVEPDSWLADRPLSEAFAATDHRLQLHALVRSGRKVAPMPSMVLRAGDRLILRDTAANLKEIEGVLKAKLHNDAEPAVNPSDSSTRDDVTGEEDEEDEADTARKPEAVPSALVAQIIVTPQSPLVGRSIRRERIAERYGVAVVGLRPRLQHAAWQRQGLADRSLEAGDILLVQGEADAMRAAQHEGVGLLLDERFTLPRQDKALLALATLAVVVMLAATKLLPIALAALCGVLVLLLGRCLSWQDVTTSLSVKVILLVSASLALGDALDLTGGTAWLAQHLADASRGLGPAAVAALLMALMGLVTNFVSNNAAAAIGTPLGVALAHSLGVEPEPFVLAVLFGCNLCYLTPMGYQTNLLVMNAAGYRFGDFLRVGTPLFLIMWAALSFLLAWRYGL
ncbi:MAG: SLC13 family permease [Burkholderiaceae bacterium]